MSIQHELAAQILAVVHLIPVGKVASYGQVAQLAGLPKHARLVGKVLQQIASDHDIAWHRVINAQGRISTQKLNSFGENEQIVKLLQEGVVVINGRVDLKTYRWVV